MAPPLCPLQGWGEFFRVLLGVLGFGGGFWAVGLAWCVPRG